MQSAIEKLKAVVTEMIASPEDSSYLFDLGKEVNLYSAPTPTGSALVRERMKLSDAAFQKLVINWTWFHCWAVGVFRGLKEQKLWIHPYGLSLDNGACDRRKNWADAIQAQFHIPVKSRPSA